MARIAKTEQICGVKLAFSISVLVDIVNFLRQKMNFCIFDARHAVCESPLDGAARRFMSKGRRSALGHPALHLLFGWLSIDWHAFHLPLSVD